MAQFHHQTVRIGESGRGGLDVVAQIEHNAGDAFGGFGDADAEEQFVVDGLGVHPRAFDARDGVENVVIDALGIVEPVGAEFKRAADFDCDAGSVMKDEMADSDDGERRGGRVLREEQRDRNRERRDQLHKFIE